MLLSPFINSPSPTASTSPFSTSAAPFLPWKYVHQYNFSRFHIYALINYIWVSSSEVVEPRACYTEWKVRKRKTNMAPAFWLSFWLCLYFSALICVKSLFLIKGTSREQAWVQGGGRVLSVLCTSWAIPLVTPNHFSFGGCEMFYDENYSYLF